MYTSVHVIRKINSESNRMVQHYATIVEQAAAAANVRLVSAPGIDERTLIVAVGGDGTMLEAMRLSALRGGVSVGINMGNVGFLTDMSPDSVNVDNMVALIHGDVDAVIEHRIALVGSSPDRNVLSCNEISVAPTSSDTMITYRLRVDHHDAGTHRANSFLISTATGSTAYALSAGGALMMPSVDALQLVPVAPMTLTSRPIIVPSSSTITVEAYGGGISVRSDGQVVNGQPQRATSERPYVVTVEKHPNPVRVTHVPRWNFFSVLSQKFGWNRVS